MWGHEQTYRMMAEERIRQYHKEAEAARRAEQAGGSRGSTQVPAADLLERIRRMIVHRYLLPLLASVRRE